MAEEQYWEIVVRRIREEKEEADALLAKRVKNVDLMVIALRHLDNLLRAGAMSSMSSDPDALATWSDAWESAEGFLKHCKEQGLL